MYKLTRSHQEIRYLGYEKTSSAYKPPEQKIQFLKSRERVDPMARKIHSSALKPAIIGKGNDTFSMYLYLTTNISWCPKSLKIRVKKEEKTKTTYEIILGPLLLYLVIHYREE